MRCPACATENHEDALVCTMCKRVLRREGDPLPAPDAPDLPHHAIDLPGDRPLAIELVERPRRVSERPAPPPDSPGTNPHSARTISHRPPPPAPAPVEIGALERAADWIARPFDALVWLSVRTRDDRRDRASRTTRVGVILQILGSAIVMVIASRLAPQPGAPPILPIGLGILSALAAIGARAWIGRSWDRGRDPSPLATIGVTMLPYLVGASIVVVGIGAWIGGLRRGGPDAPVELTDVGRLLIFLAIAFYLGIALAAAVRDRARTAREAHASGSGSRASGSHASGRQGRHDA